MLLFAGLGNPGAKYASHRHNIGFMAADAIARRHSFSPWTKKFQAEVAEGRLDGETTIGDADGWRGAPDERAVGSWSGQRGRGGARL